MYKTDEFERMSKMETFADYLETIDNEDHRQIMKDLFEWTDKEFPQLDHRIAWNQPMYVNNGTFIIAFSPTKKHISVAPEKAALKQFSEELQDVSYDITKELFKIKWTQPIYYELLRDIIQFNIDDKQDYPHFWRK